MRSPNVCPFCRSLDTVPLPDPSMQSMTSDWRVVPTPLGKLSCKDCLLAFRNPALPPAAEFDRNYELYAHPPGGPAERIRQAAYAAWIAGAVNAPKRLLDVGCGNGSLLLALRAHWSHAELSGCDLSPGSVRFAQAAGLSVWAGGAADVSPGDRVDLVISVNVLEHAPDPRAFLCGLASAVGVDGQLAIVCPDGTRPGVELLIADHLYSFTATHLEALLGAAGFTVCHWSRAPRELGPFQMVVAARQAVASEACEFGGDALLEGRLGYLRAWQQLDAVLLARLAPQVVCFGAGEAAALLRAYAPGAWARVDACTTDEGAVGTFGDRRHVPLADVSAEATVLVGVRPQDQPAIAERLRSRFVNVVTWYDLVPSDDAG